ncbi:MAG TPA: helix-turn-helix domain-containing protein [Candidatus Mediterraneibacter pullicola]|uniref:Helix-turn-helix domain-containing protein n=1 Tax=Candidatus Mediterraneibacter pullicola TaxID=2838682 RepID=A0A9D2HB46_9FIRM|nr:helix-turn-helix domain-containing protein [Candidatus Mediterraneibacter pullicola]
MSIIQLANNLHRLRTENNYTQEQIGEKLNISRQAYSNYETGKRIPDIDMLIRIADIYEVTLEQLITQTCTSTGIINETSGPYFTGKVLENADTIYLTKEEADLLMHYRNAGEDERKLTRKVLGV